jgi:hypothetical protein
MALRISSRSVRRQRAGSRWWSTPGLAQMLGSAQGQSARRRREVSPGWPGGAGKSGKLTDGHCRTFRGVLVVALRHGDCRVWASTAVGVGGGGGGERKDG